MKTAWLLVRSQRWHLLCFRNVAMESALLSVTAAEGSLITAQSNVTLTWCISPQTTIFRVLWRSGDCVASTGFPGGRAVCCCWSTPGQCLWSATFPALLIVERLLIDTERVAAIICCYCLDPSSPLIVVQNERWKCASASVQRSL